MSRVKRIAVVLVLVACLPLVTGGGGINPPPLNPIVVGPTVEAIVVIDPHETFPPPPVTTTAKRGTIWLSRKGFGTAGAPFSVPQIGFPLSLGCDLSLTEARFVNNGGTPVPLDSWMPGELVTSLFDRIGITVSPTFVPAITAIKTQKCSADPNPVNNESVPAPGFLVMRVDIGFLIPGGTNPVKVWVGLTNSDDVGVSFDVQATLKLNGAGIGTGQVDGVSGLSSGFPNARLVTIPLTAFPAGDFTSRDIVTLEILVRTACVGSRHSSGSARVWFNGPPIDSGPSRNAGSRVLLSSGFVPTDFFLVSSFRLSEVAGTSRLFVDKAAGTRCSIFKPVASWSMTIP